MCPKHIGPASVMEALLAVKIVNLATGSVGTVLGW
jgi:hypothetical protein